MIMFSDHSTFKSYESRFIKSHLTVCKACSHGCTSIFSANSLALNTNPLQAEEREALYASPRSVSPWLLSQPREQEPAGPEATIGLLLLELKANRNHSGAFAAEDATLEGRCFKLVWAPLFLGKTEQFHP